MSLPQHRPILALAPMQDVTDLPFWRLMACYGGADLYYTEYFRVHPDSHLEKPILRSLDENPTGRPAIAQMIGNDIPSLVRSAKELQRHPVVGIDLNLGCPAPVVYKKCAGGGLLREPERIDRILGALRDAVSCAFTVKTRVGFESEREFDTLLPLFQKHAIDLLTVHGRTVKQMYRPGVHRDLIALAAREMPCPVLANGDVSRPEDVDWFMNTTSVAGVMIGRGAIQNPWLFDQIRDRSLPPPTGRDVLGYIHDLYETVTVPETNEQAQVNKLKKYMNFLGTGLPRANEFLHAIRRVTDRTSFFQVCLEHLDHGEVCFH
jgi:tRNA-dihydrouridine synthase B